MSKENTVFYKCPICGNIIGLIEGDSNHITCCGQKMKMLIANTEDAATEKHVPVYEKQNNEIMVKVGEVEHPMDEEHFIMWIAQVSENQTTRIRLHPNNGATVKFKYIPGATIYAYCNKHGLWKTEVK